MLSNEIKRLKMKKIKFENFEKKNPEIRHLPTNHPYSVYLDKRPTFGYCVQLCKLKSKSTLFWPAIIMYYGIYANGQFSLISEVGL